MTRTSEGWKAAYQEANALFVHNEDMKRPHPLLTSGNHSGMFFNSRLIIANEPLLQEAAFDLVDLLLSVSFNISRVHRVVGPQTGATKLAEFISNAIAVRRGYPCAWASPAKTGEPPDRKMVWDDPDRKVLPGEEVLICEDVVTTAGSVLLTKEAVIEAGGNPYGIIPVLVNRSPATHTDKFDRLVSLIRHEAPIWTPEKCPYCIQGSVAIAAKDPANWKLLTAA